MKKRLAAVFCCIVMCCLLLPVTALAGGPELGKDYEYESDTRNLRLIGSMANARTDSEGYLIFYDMDYNKIDPAEIVKIDIGNALTSVDEALLLDSRFKNVHTYCFMGCSTAVVKASSTPTLSSTTIVHTFNDKDCSSYKWAKSLGEECELEFHSFESCDSSDSSTAATHTHQCTVCGCLEEVSVKTIGWSWSDGYHWKECPDCGMVVGGESEKCTYVQDPATGKLLCSVCKHEKEGGQSNLIDASKTISLSAYMPFTFGAGSYLVSGDPTVYSGNQNFFVKADGQYTFTRR